MVACKIRLTYLRDGSERPKDGGSHEGGRDPCWNAGAGSPHQTSRGREHNRPGRTTTSKWRRPDVRTPIAEVSGRPSWTGQRSRQQTSQHGDTWEAHRSGSLKGHWSSNP
ncbi:hypothetical protein FKM82_024504 [Ascaphus truei]